MRIEVFSDVVCPFCYVGKRRLAAALAETGITAQLHWRSFELDPAAPPLLSESLTEMLAAKYRVPIERAGRMLDQQRQALASVGIDFDWRAAKRGNTFDAHRLIALGAEHGRADEVCESLMRGYFSEGAAIGDPATLTALATRAGLAAGAVAAVLAGDDHAATVRADERAAGELGVHAVPHFVIDSTVALSGAVSTQELAAALRTAAQRRG